MYHIVYTKKSISGIDKLKSAKLDKKAKKLIDIIKVDPFQNPPSYKKRAS